MELFSSKTLTSLESARPSKVVDEENDETTTIPINSSSTAARTDSSTSALVSASSRDDKHQVAFSFAELGLSDWLCQTTTSLGYRRPTIVQSSCIPGILQGKDVMACAETGSGKTATFVLPMLQILAQDPFGIFAVILTPTRELAIQISDQISALGASLQVTTALVIGGMNMIQQGLQLSRRPHFVIATPGRLRAHLEGADPPNIRRAKFLVLDEADRLLALGFASELSVILQHINPRRQTLLFSATLTHTLEELQSLALRDGATLRHNSTVQTDGDGQVTISGGSHHGRQLPATLTQQYVVVPAKLKLCYLLLLLSKFFSPPPTDSSDDKKKSKKAAIGAPETQLTLADAIASKKTREELKAAASNKRPVLKNKKRKFRGSDSDFAFVEELLKKNQAAGGSNRLSQVIVFVESCSRCHELSLTIQELLRAAHRRGFVVSSSGEDNQQGEELTCVALHGMLTQSQRVQALQQFRDVTARILVATDVASRGLDMQAVDYVISYDLPRVAADYVHRAGRTARAGRRGTTTTMVTPHDIALLQGIEQACETRLSAREDIKITDTQPLLLPVAKAVQTVQLAILSSDFKEKEEKFKERKRQQKKSEQRQFGGAAAGDEPPATAEDDAEDPKPKKKKHRGVSEEAVQDKPLVSTDEQQAPKKKKSKNAKGDTV
eukprot:gene2580-1876_t